MLTYKGSEGAIPQVQGGTRWAGWRRKTKKSGTYDGKVYKWARGGETGDAT